MVVVVDEGDEEAEKAEADVEEGKAEADEEEVVEAEEPRGVHPGLPLEKKVKTTDANCLPLRAAILEYVDKK